MIGKLLMAGTKTNSHWFGRWGDEAGFFCDVIANQGAGNGLKFVIKVFTKNAEDPDSTATSIATLTLDNTSTWNQVHSVTGTGFKELLRYEYDVQRSGTRVGDYVHFRMLDPIWETN